MPSGETTGPAYDLPINYVNRFKGSAHCWPTVPPPPSQRSVFQTPADTPSDDDHDRPEPRRHFSCTKSCSSAMAKANGTRKTASPVGMTSIYPEKGREEARKGGQTLKKEGYAFDVALPGTQARHPYALDRTGRNGPDVDSGQPTWRLNERHYGNLTGLNKAETAAQHGEEQVKIWRQC